MLHDGRYELELVNNQQNRAMSRLDRLTIRGFKSIRALEDFELRNLNVLIGANGAGKSNFISLFQMLAQLSEKRLQLFVGQQDGPDALLFGGRKRTQQLEAKFVFDENGYEFALVPAGERLIFADEMLSAGGGLGEQQSLGSGHEEARLPDVADDAVAKYIWPVIRSWRVYHFHDTTPSAPMRQAQAVSTYGSSRTRAIWRRSCATCVSNTRKTTNASWIPRAWQHRSSGISCTAGS